MHPDPWTWHLSIEPGGRPALSLRSAGLGAARVRPRCRTFTQLFKANRPDLTFGFSLVGLYLVEVPKGDHLL